MVSLAALPLASTRWGKDGSSTSGESSTISHRQIRYKPEHQDETMQQDTNGYGANSPMSPAEMAAALIASRGSEGMLDRYFAFRNACHRECWQKVLTALLQAEDETPIPRLIKSGDKIVVRSN